MSAVEIAKSGILAIAQKESIYSGKPLPPIRTLSEQIGVSRDSVWRAINALKKQGLIESMDNGRYLIASRWVELQAQQKLHLAVFAEGSRFIAKPLLSRYVNGLNAAAAIHGDTISLHLASDESGAALPANPDYIIALGDVEIPASYLEQNASAPVIGVQTHPGRQWPSILTCDHFLGGELSAQTILEAGYEKPTLISWAHNNNLWSSFHLRILGFQKRWLEAGRSLESVRIVQLDADSLIRRLSALDETVNTTIDTTDCYFCFNDEAAAFVTDLLLDQSRHVPEQIGVVGFDGASNALNHEPPITTVLLPMEEMGRQTLDLLRQSEHKGSPIGAHVFKPSVSPGQTTRPVLTNAHTA